MTVFRWGTITDDSPLRVRLDGDSNELPFTPDSGVDPAQLQVGDRVRCEISGGRVNIHFKSGGTAVSDYDLVPRFTTVALLLASSPSNGHVARADNAPGALFVRQSGSWVMYGTPRFADSSARSSAISSPVTGMLTQLDTERFVRRYNGSAWKPFGAGSVPLVPTIASSGGTAAVDSDGRVTFSGSITSLRWNLSTALINEFSAIEGTFEYHGSSSGTHTTRTCLGSTVRSAASTYVAHGAYASDGAAAVNFYDPAATTSWADGALGSRAHKTLKFRLTNLGQARETDYFVTGAVWDADHASTVALVGINFGHTPDVADDGLQYSFSGNGTVSGGLLTLTGVL